MCLRQMPECKTKSPGVQNALRACESPCGLFRSPPTYPDSRRRVAHDDHLRSCAIVRLVFFNVEDSPPLGYSLDYRRNTRLRNDTERAPDAQQYFARVHPGENIAFREAVRIPVYGILHSGPSEQGACVLRAGCLVGK